MLPSTPLGGRIWTRFVTTLTSYGMFPGSWSLSRKPAECYGRKPSTPAEVACTTYLSAYRCRPKPWTLSVAPSPLKRRSAASRLVRPPPRPIPRRTWFNSTRMGYRSSMTADTGRPAA
ncbi:hypothetical protein KPH14_012802 [Odynerus spinipes]|uniref:Uncharacterized protein n=1 Tax=Odynerus spinipes TaxID=1348599 RepID=A0AAD9RFV5_9HYME|nr:hypothetical protein KPH14_012802 [Odynerus spinipes]